MAEVSSVGPSEPPADLTFEKRVSLDEAGVQENARYRAEAKGTKDVEAAVARALFSFRAKPYVRIVGHYREPRADGSWAEFAARVKVAGRFWRVNGSLADSPYGRVIVRELTIKPWPGSTAEPNPSLLGRLPIPTIRDKALEILRGGPERTAFLDDHAARSGGRIKVRSTDAERAEIEQAASRAGPKQPRRGRGGAGMDFYRQLAADAIRVAKSGLPIYKTLARERQMNEPSVKAAIRTARTEKIGTLDPRPNTWAFGPNFQEKE
jgi:hypothetical protein